MSYERNSGTIFHKNGWNWRYTVQEEPKEGNIVRWIPLEETIDTEDKNIWNLLRSDCEEDRYLAVNILENSDTVHFDMYTCEMTQKLLELASPYYEYIGIRTRTPQRVLDNQNWGLDHSAFGQAWDIGSQTERGGYFIDTPGWSGWPAIWRLCDKAGVKSSCGNSHQRQINTELSTGLYHFKNNKWFKRIIWNTENMKEILLWLR